MAARRSRPAFQQTPTFLVSDAIAEQHAQDVAVATGTRIPFFDWSLRVPEPKSGTLDFERFPFQKELYHQGAAEQEAVVMKSTQVGVSAFLVRWVMYWADVKSVTALYVFPKLQQMYDFADARVKASILGSEYLLGRIPGGYVQNKGLKQIGGGWVYFRGSETKTALDSVDADVLALDEYDTLQQDNIPDAERRLSGSQIGFIRRVGVPSTPNWGIDALYNESDMRRWLVKCGACGEWQPMTFDDNVDQERLLRVCRKCRKPVDVSTGEWVPEHPDRDVRGYHLPRLIVPDVNLKDIVKASKKTRPYDVQVHYNKDRGEAYAPEEGRLSEAALQAAQSAGGGYTLQPGYQGANLVTMGVDVASVRNLNVRISEHLDDGRKRALFLAEVRDFNELDRLMQRFSVKMAAIDHLPEGRLAMAFAEKYAGRVYLVAQTANQKVVMAVDDDLRKVTVRRVELFDSTFEAIRRQENLLPLDLPEGYLKQLQNLQRHVEEDPETGKKVVSYRATGPDDYAQCEAYDVVATEAWWYRQNIEESEREVFTPLEEMLEFERSGLGEEPSLDDEYSPGPEEPDFPDGWG